MMHKDLRVYLDDIIQSIQLIEDYTKNLRIDVFYQNTAIQDAVVRRLEIIGEAANKLPKQFHHKYPDIPWSKMIGLRNIVVHDYSNVDMELVWNLIQTTLKDTKQKIIHVFSLLDTR